RAGVDQALALRVSRDWPRGLRDLLLRCLDADPPLRPASGNAVARELELCLQPKAHLLLLPPLRSWRHPARRVPIACVLVAAVFPNICAAVFNYFYNRREIVEHLQDSQKAFEQTQAAINAIAFPVGIFFVFWFTRPIAAAIRRARRGDEGASVPSAAASPQSSRDKTLPSDASSPGGGLFRLRQNCLRLGHLAAGISLALWLVAAPAYPIALQMEVGDVPASAYLHFVASLTLCGLIAAAYPFFGVSCLSVCSFYPALV